MALCIVCAKDSSRYRCRFCHGAYCSSVCHKTHRDVDRPDCCAGVPKRKRDGEPHPPPHLEASSVVAARCNEGEEQEECEKNEEAGSKRGREGDLDFIYGERDEDGVLVVLGEAHLAALAQDGNVRRKLRSDELRRLLRIINSSRSRVDALDAALANIVEFKEFCDDVLRVVATAERDLKPRVL